MGLGPTLVTSFYLHHLFKGPAPNTVTFWVLEIRTSVCEFWGRRPACNVARHVAVPTLLLAGMCRSCPALFRDSL